MEFIQNIEIHELWEMGYYAIRREGFRIIVDVEMLYVDLTSFSFGHNNINNNFVYLRFRCRTCFVSAWKVAARVRLING